MVISIICVTLFLIVCAKVITSGIWRRVYLEGNNGLKWPLKKEGIIDLVLTCYPPDSDSDPIYDLISREEILASREEILAGLPIGFILELKKGCFGYRIVNYEQFSSKNFLIGGERICGINNRISRRKAFEVKTTGGEKWTLKGLK